MNREIKFRAWNKGWKDKKMIYFGIFDTDNGGHIDKNFFTDLHESVIMQYTGLKDKNGKEIYEGDLFNCIYDFDGCTEHIMEIIHDEEHARFHLKSHGEACHQQGVIKHIWDFKDKEIIGNIYETPDLLN